MCLAKLEVSLTYVMTEFLSASCVTPCTRLGCPSNLLSWLKTLHGYSNAIYENLGTSVHADLMV